MSWLYAVVGRSRELTNDPAFSRIHLEPLQRFQGPNFYIAVGGIAETCVYHKINENSGWAVVGLGIRNNGTTARIMGKEDWLDLLRSGSFDPRKLDGHFIVFRWNGEEIECYTDQIGLRTVYFAPFDEALCVSTRLDWVAHTTRRSDIDFASLGNTWLYFNQIAYESNVVGIGRLGPGGYLSAGSGGTTQSRNTNWTPTFGNNSMRSSIDILESIVDCALSHEKPVSLGLSGGLDSRVLLALCTSREGSRFRVHSFGDSMDPDVRISGEIARELSVERMFFDEPVPDTNALLRMLQEFVPQSKLTESASSILKLRYFSRIRENGYLMIDGGFGEIARRQFLNRLAVLGRKALRTKGVPEMLGLMRVHRGDFFSDEVVKTMRPGAEMRLQTAITEMPPAETIGIGNFVDLLTVRYRVPNYGGPEQARLDGEVMNFMPFIQPTFLRAVFAAGLKQRNRGKSYRETIRKKCPRLADFPLAKAGTTVPFGAAGPAASVLTKIKARVGRTFADPLRHVFLMALREYVQDLAHSDNVKGWSGYDGRKVIRLVEGYYSGDTRLGAEVDWWLTFELWRRSLECVSTR
jgi:hypothetical protein